MSSDHSCEGKARRIQTRVGGELLDHEAISWLCSELGSLGPDDFYAIIARMSDSDLKAWVERARKRRKGLYNYLNQTAEVPVYIS